MVLDNATIFEMIENATRKSASGTVAASKSAQTAIASLSTVDGVVESAKAGYQTLLRTSLADREEYIEAIREIIREHAWELAEIEHGETGMGRIKDKVTKMLLTVDKTPGVNDIKAQAQIGDYGLIVEEFVPFGVVLCITPSTAACCTAIGNAICMIAAGNSVVLSPHPNASKCTRRTVELINEAIVSAGGPSNIINVITESTLANTQKLIAHPGIELLVATGGPAIVKQLLSSGKKAIGAGPGNPPVVVDDSADLADAARCILAGNYFENGIQCICEKEIIVVDSVADQFISHIEKLGAYVIRDWGTIVRLTELVTTPKGDPAKEYLGKDPAFILAAIGVKVPSETKSIVFEVPRDHIIAQEEYLMPLLPVVRAKDIREAIEMAVEMEGGRRHSAMIHSKNVSHLSDFVRALGCTIMVKNGPSYASLGMGGEGISGVTVAGPTGEGITSPRTFTRRTRCSMVGEFNLRTTSL